MVRGSGGATQTQLANLHWVTFPSPETMDSQQMIQELADFVQSRFDFRKRVSAFLTALRTHMRCSNGIATVRRRVVLDNKIIFRVRVDEKASESVSEDDWIVIKDELFKLGYNFDVRGNETYISYVSLLSG